MDNTLMQSEVFRLPNMKGIIKVFPTNNKLQQILIGDDSGNLYILDNNNDQFKVDIKQQISTARDIIYIDLVMSPNTMEKDRIIVTSGSVIIGLTRKLKEYLKHDTFNAEPIQFAMIEGNQLFTAGDYLLNEFKYQNDKVQQAYFYLSPGKINCLQVHYLSSKAHALLGCQDSCIRVLDEDKVLYVLIMTSPVVCMHIYSPIYNQIISQNKFEQRRCFVYGLEDGTIIAADMGIEKATILFQMKVESIVCLKPFDFFKTGKTDLLVVRQDGNIEIYSDNELRVSKKINEGITSVECGQFFNLQGGIEILVSTFSGKILLLRENNTTQLDKNQKKIELQIKKLKEEITELQNKVNKDKQQNTKQIAKNQVKFKLSHKLINNDKDGTYKLIIDCQYPIELIILNGLKTQKLYNIKDLKVNNYELNIIQSDVYNVFIIPIDINSSQSFTLNVKPLGSYLAISKMSIKDIPLSSLTLKGQFTKQDITMWIGDLTDLQNSSDEETQLHLFRNPFLDSYLQVKFKQGQALFKSDSVATIYTCKEYIMNRANERCLQVEVKWECNNESVMLHLQKIKQQYDECVRLRKNYEILPAIKELLLDNPITILSKDFLQIYNNEQELQQIQKELPNKIQYLEDLLLDTYKARCHLKSLHDVNVEHVKSLWKRDFKELIQYIMK